MHRKNLLDVLVAERLLRRRPEQEMIAGWKLRFGRAGSAQHQSGAQSTHQNLFHAFPQYPFAPV